MSHGQSFDEENVEADDWPDFELAPTYNPKFLPASVEVETDEVVLYDPEDCDGGSDRWISADRDSHVSLSDSQ
ncbi:hypothetical protein KTS45_14665 [Halomicroarcula limicola]|uniref:Uncharacterized protein n=1 Tax=Haloarcula limicola TaxID=1429915 RepID=A0A8J7Y7F9_9EURY|nr:hypothetical protein [Halomicroarcula limicola]MBV0925447.1 hypothetical protein [Halomicroarcula limicola]